MADQTDMGWVGTWATTPSATDGFSLDGQTLRMIVHTSIGGGTLRVRLSNAYGKQKLAIGAAHVALRSDGADIIAESGRALTFNGKASTTIAAGALVVSDPVELDVPALGDLAISIYQPGRPRKLMARNVTGEVCLDFDEIGHIGFQRRPDHQIGAVGWPQSEIFSIRGRGRLRLAPIRMPSGECRLN